MTTAREQVTVFVNVKSRAQEADGWTLEVDVPQFQSSYPTKMTRVDATLASQLPPGTGATVTLERQNLKRGKTGSKAWDYYWGLVGVGGTAQTVTGPATPAPGPAPQPVFADPTRQSIERQVALKAAVELAVAGKITLDLIGAYASRFIHWINGTPPDIEETPEMLTTHGEDVDPQY